MHRHIGFWGVFGTMLVLLAASLAALFAARGDWAWSVGFLFLAYDTWLLTRLIAWSRRALRDLPASPSESGPRPTLSVLVPARNECSVLPACLDALLAEGAVASEIVVIDDGSEDGTRAMLARRYGLPAEGERVRSTTLPRLSLWSKPTSGKARSFNQILPECSGDLVVTIDADTEVAPGSLVAMAEAFAADPRLAAGCGILRPRCREGRLAGFFEFFQRFEYQRAFLWRLAWSRINALVLVSGAFAVYRREVLARIGGFDAGSWVEDYELLYRLHRRAGDEGLPWRVAVIPGARAVTDAPSRPGQFLRQRSRWFGGFLGTLFANRDMVGSSRYGGMGRRLLPLKTIDTVLPAFTAVAQISLVCFVIRGAVFGPVLWALLIAKLLFDLAMHLWALRLYAGWLDLPLRARWISASLLASFLEPFLFQPLRYTGALLGWVAFLRNRFTWESQRLGSAPAAAEELH